MAAKRPTRTARRRPDAIGRYAPWAIGAGLIAAGAAVAGALIGLRRPREGHVPTDLLKDRRPRAGDRADPAFRPDPTAMPTRAERAAMAPVTTPVPSARDITVEPAA